MVAHQGRMRQQTCSQLRKVIGSGSGRAAAAPGEGRAAGAGLVGRCWAATHSPPWGAARSAARVQGSPWHRWWVP